MGDPDVVAVYDAHGRIRGGTEQEMVAAAVRGYLADVLEGHRSLLVVRSDAMATELSAQIRAELVAAGRVSAEVLGQTRDGNLVGVGDLLQARLNDYTLRVHGGRPVTNREIYEVVGRNRLTGTLTVRDRDGIRAHLPAAYVRHHTTLAYAVTSYGAQGQTVYSTHDLVDQGTTRAGVYVPGSRGTDANTFYVICQHAPDHHDPERIDRTPVAVLTDILTRPVDRNTAAEIARRARDRGNPLAGLGRHPVGPAHRRAQPPPRHRHPQPAAARRGRPASGRRARLRPADVRAAGDGAGRARPARGAHLRRRTTQPARCRLYLRRAALPHPAARQRQSRSRADGAGRGLDHLRRTVDRTGRRLRPGARYGRHRAADRAR